MSDFRGFSRIKAQGFERFNLILGRNNAGKTALLEAMFLLAGPTNPQLSLTVNSFRGIDQFKITPEEMWGWIFHNKDVSKSIVFESIDCDSVTRALKISVAVPRVVKLTAKKEKKTVPQKGQTSAVTDIGFGQLVLEYSINQAKQTRTTATIGPGGTVSINHSKQRIHLPTSIFVSSRSGYSPENPERFSTLEESNREKEILPALKMLEPRLERLAVLVGASGPMIYGDIGIGRMVPIPLMGEGVGRLLTLLLAIVSCPDGMVFIDDIDTGLHYSAMENIWRAVAQLGRANNTQLFATTHSIECVRAAHESFKSMLDYDFRLQRIDRSGTAVKATLWDKEMIDSAFSSGLELR